MYFPYLRGRQFELIALREFAIEHTNQNKVIPIIEPVKKTFNSFKIALSKFKESNSEFAIILNPKVGEIDDSKCVWDNLSNDLEGSNWIPALKADNNINEVQTCISEFNLKDVMLICSKELDTSTDEFANFITAGKIKYIVTEENKSLKRKFRGSDIQLILLSDCFQPKKRNSDYLDAPAKKFTEEHLFFEDDGYYGFADYTTVASEFNEGGSTPYAVSIHLTFQKENEEVWIRHFTSFNNDDQSNIQGKFAEAAHKAVDFLNTEGIHTIASEELRKYFNETKYPGLGMVKKISIKNHLELINEIL